MCLDMIAQYGLTHLCVCVCDTYSLSTVETEALTKETYGEF